MKSLMFVLFTCGDFVPGMDKEVSPVKGREMRKDGPLFGGNKKLREKINLVVKKISFFCLVSLCFVVAFAPLALIGKHFLLLWFLWFIISTLGLIGGFVLFLVTL